MGMLSDINIKPDSESFKSAYTNSVKDALRSGGGFSVLGISIGFSVRQDYTEDQRQKIADSFEASVNSENSKFKEMFGEKVLGNFVNIIDAIPELKLLSAVGVQDYTKPIVPIVNQIVDTISDIGIPDPYSFVLENIDKITKEFTPLIADITSAMPLGQEEVEELTTRVENILLSLDASLPIDTVREKITEFIENFQIPLSTEELEAMAEEKAAGFLDSLGIPDPILPVDIILPNIELPNIELPSIEDLLNLIMLEIPPGLGTIVIEILKEIIDFIVKLMSGSPPAPFDDPFALADKFSQGFNAFLAGIVEGIVNPIFTKISENEIIKKISENMTFAAAFGGMLVVIIKLLLVSVIGILVGSGLIMQAAAIALGLLV